MKKKRFITISLILALVLIITPVKISADIPSIWLESGEYITPYSAELTIKRNIGEVVYLAHPLAGNYPSIGNLMNAPNLYNCFTYAFIYDGNVTGLSEMPSSETFFLENPKPLIGGQNPCYEYIEFEDIQKGDIAIYRYATTENYAGGANNIIHAGIVFHIGSSLESTYLHSKWGEYAIYCHRIDQCPYIGSGISLADFDDLIEQEEVKISFARMTHSYVYYNYYVVPVDGETVIQSDTYHKLKCSGCGAFHFERHDEKGSEAIMVTIGTLTTSTQHRVICGCGYNHNTTEAHSYGNDGLCKDCGYSPILLNNVEDEVDDQ